MLTEKQILEVKEHLEKAVNPIFFFDNDVDGLCSFLLLARYSGRGKGVAIKSFPELDKNYIRKLYELKPDYVFILDKPLVSREFIDECFNLNLPVVWIDHHDVEVDSKGASYYNPSRNEEQSFEPVTYLCWQATKKKEDLWLAVAGCVSDNFLPDFCREFSKEGCLGRENAESAFEMLYETEIGKVARILNFALNDRTSNVVRMLKFMLKAGSPYDILAEEQGNFILFRFKQLDKKYQKLIEKAKKFVSGKKLIYFQYGGDLSLSAELANELFYRFPNKIVVVAYIKGTKANISFRGRNVKEITLKAISGLENATGGGHNDATGAKINSGDLPEFKKRIESLAA